MKKLMNEKPVILITGSRSGMGRALVEHFIESSYTVIGCSRSSTDLDSDDYHHFELDISDEKSVKGMFRNIRKEYGRIDCLINNAGIASINNVLLTPLIEVNNVFNTNFVGTFLACREAVKLMKKSNFGRIINISSIHTNFAIKGTSIYGSSKVAVEQFTKVLANEIIEYGITANVLSLSVVEKTGMSEAISQEIYDEILSKSQTKEYVKVSDVIEQINYLISSKSDHFSGNIIQIG